MSPSTHMSYGAKAVMFAITGNHVCLGCYPKMEDAERAVEGGFASVDWTLRGPNYTEAVATKDNGTTVGISIVGLIGVAAPGTPLFSEKVTNKNEARLAYYIDAAHRKPARV